jgi:hypothetical protein
MIMIYREERFCAELSAKGLLSELTRRKVETPGRARDATRNGKHALFEPQRGIVGDVWRSV